MRGFAKCEKSQTSEQRASFYFGGYKCDKGDYWSGGSAFQPADEIVIQKRREKHEYFGRACKRGLPAISPEKLAYRRGGKHL